MALSPLVEHVLLETSISNAKEVKQAVDAIADWLEHSEEAKAATKLRRAARRTE